MKGACVLLLCCRLLASAEADADDRLPSAMERDPELPTQRVVHTAPAGMVELWYEAIDQAAVEDEVVAEVAKGLIRLRRLEIEIDDGVRQKVLDRLAVRLQESTPGLAARLAVVQALVEFDARRHAEILAAQLSDGGRDMAEIVEPALIRWKDPTLQDVWLERLTARHTPQQLLRLAIRAQSSLKNSMAREPLRQIVADRGESPDIRMEAARSLAAFCNQGLEPDADALTKARNALQSLEEMLAVQMLSRHTSKEAKQLLLRLARSSNPAVAAGALTRLIELDPALVQSQRNDLLDKDDPGLRLLGIRLISMDLGSDGLPALGKMLADEHRDVRRSARDALVAAAIEPSLREEVLTLTVRLLDDTAPLQTEQAIHILASLDFQEANGRLLELVGAEDPRVSVTAAWALERLATPDIAEPLLFLATAEVDRTIDALQHMAPSDKESTTTSGLDLLDLDLTYIRLEHVILALGQLRHERAVDLLSRFVRKPVWQAGDPPLFSAFDQPRPRAAAIWSLGKIYEGRGDETPPALLRMLTDRATDATPIPREEPIVRRMAATSLGRIGAESSLPALRDAVETGSAHDRVGRACLWAIEQLTGESPPPLPPQVVPHADWFLMPLN